MLEIETSSGEWSPFCRLILDFLAADTIELCVDGKDVRGFRSPDSPALWIRDHSDMLRGGKYFVEDVRSAIDAFASAQMAGGRIHDYVSARPEKPPCERENWEKWVRVPVEADVEYRFVKGAYLAWQATGDDSWMTGMLPACERALTYMTTHPWRWDDEHRLVKRPYTIDTWDFDYTAGRAPWLNFQVTDQTYWGIMHGDNSGLFEASVLLARMYEAAGNSEDAQRWERLAREIRERANSLLFNGRFYMHVHKLTPLTIEGVDEAEQLSLSNPMAINRGMATHEIAVAVLNEYIRRGDTSTAFAPWFSIDPPFPDGIFGDGKLVGGAYINGGIFPLVGGELARAAFEHGFERYGCDILRQYGRMIGESGEAYLWYFPDGTPSSVETSTSPEATSTDGWGSSAMLYALIEGLCGIEDRSHSYRHVRCAPRWAAAGEEKASVRVGYTASGAGFGYTYAHRPESRSIEMTLKADHAAVELHVLLPQACRAESVECDGRSVAFTTEVVQNSAYADFGIDLKQEAVVHIRYAGTALAG